MCLYRYEQIKNEKYFYYTLTEDHPMKNSILTLILVIITTTAIVANEQDTLWYRFLGRDIHDVDFTPDDQFVIAWTQNLEFWDIETGTMDFHIPYIGLGDFNYNNELIVYSQDSTPKLINWQTKEITEGFVKEEYDFGRIKTAKSKNEFMADLIDDENKIYFWDVITKQRKGEINFLDTIERDGFKWKRTIHEYDYIGSNDEYLYVIFDDVNSKIDNIPPSEHLRNYFIHIYNVDSKELIDSIFSFQNTSEKFGGFNKIAVLNDRNKIALNNEGGVINFYNVETRTFYDKLFFDEENSVEAGDIAFNTNNSIIGVSQGSSCCRYIKIYSLSQKNLIYQYNVGSFGELDFSNDDNYLVTKTAQILILYPKHWTLSNINNYDIIEDIEIFPNPSNGKLQITFRNVIGFPLSLDIIDINGRIINQITNIKEKVIELDISDFSIGVYNLKFKFGSKVLIKQFIKE